MNSTFQLPATIKLFILMFLVNSIFLFTCSYFFPSSFAEEMAVSGEKGENGEKGEKLFKSNCSGCHLNGLNLIKSDKPIIGSMKLKTKQGFAAWLEKPNPPMPSFKNITQRENELKELYNYVISLMGN